MQSIEIPTLLRIGRAKVPDSTQRSYFSHEYWALHLYFNHASLCIADETFEILPGSLSLTPVATESIYQTESPLDHIFAHFVLREKRLGQLLPRFIVHGSKVEQIARTFVEALSVYRENPAWAAVKLWDILFAMANVQAQDGYQIAEHPALSEALTQIDMNLPNIHRLEDLSSEANVSKTHLNRLFQMSMGKSAMRYVRDKRMELARYLLLATILPVKDVAYQVGIPDVHAFNKLCKKYFGAPPSLLRNGKTPGSFGL